MSGTPTPRVSLVVLNYNGRGHLDYCLPSLASTTYTPLDIIVVDNASPDRSADLVPALCPQAEVVLNRNNLGWSGGNNVGIRHALKKGAEYVALANNDIQVDPRWIEVAVHLSEQDRTIGVVGFDVHESQPGGADARVEFDLACSDWRGPEVSMPPYVGGMAMFVRAELFSQLGLIDEGFFAYGDENDFQIRVRKAGYRVVAVNVPVWHHGSASFGAIPARASLLQVRSNIRLLLKHGKPSDLVRAALSHIASRAVSRTSSESSTAVERRLRGSSRTMGVLMLAWGVLWNVWMLPATIRRRRQDNRLAAAQRQRLRT